MKSPMNWNLALIWLITSQIRGRQQKEKKKKRKTKRERATDVEEDGVGE